MAPSGEINQTFNIMKKKEDSGIFFILLFHPPERGEKYSSQSSYETFIGKAGLQG